MRFYVGRESRHKGSKTRSCATLIVFLRDLVSLWQNVVNATELQRVAETRGLT